MKVLTLIKAKSNVLLWYVQCCSCTRRSKTKILTTKCFRLCNATWIDYLRLSNDFSGFYKRSINVGTWKSTIISHIQDVAFDGCEKCFGVRFNYIYFTAHDLSLYQSLVSVVWAWLVCVRYQGICALAFVLTHSPTHYRRQGKYTFPLLWQCDWCLEAGCGGVAMVTSAQRVFPPLAAWHQPSNNYNLLTIYF